MAGDGRLLRRLGIDEEKYRAIAVVGGGGKTSLIYKLTDELLHRNKKVIITTTTHMAFEPERPFAPDGNREKIKEYLDKYGYVIAAGYEPETNKYASLSKDRLLSLRDYGAVILIEADGAKKKPVKAPEQWEPVIPDFAELVVGVIGLDCLYKPIGEAAFRAEKTAALLGKTVDAVLLPGDLVRLSASSQGLRKGVEGRDYQVYLNKADLLTDTKAAAEIVAELKKEKHQSFLRKSEGEENTVKIAMIMLAAGNSRRFGSNKLLYEIEGIPMYRRVLAELLQAKNSLYLSCGGAAGNPEITLTVVTQYREIGEYAGAQGAEVLYNPHPERGISSSLKIGLEANRDAEACLFCVSDQPWLKAETLCSLVDTFLAANRDKNKGIACLSHKGIPGNPCIFSRKYFKELLSLEGDKGGRKVINAHREDTEFLEICDERELKDMDTRE